jgi:hypothetical protein
MPKWRPFTWVILVINVLFLVWVISAIASSAGEPPPEAGCEGMTVQECNDIEAAGTAIGVVVIIVFWAFVDVILGVIWLVTRPKGGRPCPVCGTEVKAGRTICPKCGHDFRVAASGEAPPPPPPPPAPA